MSVRILANTVFDQYCMPKCANSAYTLVSFPDDYDFSLGGMCMPGDVRRLSDKTLWLAVSS